MAKLFIFGDSFSEEFDHFIHESQKGTHRHRYLHEFLNGRIPESYGKILSNKLGLELVNRAANNGFKETQGNCNESIFNNFCLSVSEMNEGDVVIYQYTIIERLKWFEFDRLRTVLPNQLIPNISEEEQEALNHYLINKSNIAWLDDLLIKQKILNEFCEAKKIDIFYWSEDSRFYTERKNILSNDINWLLNSYFDNQNFKSIVEYVSELGGKNICQETDGDNIDTHFGESAHKVIAELFYNDIVLKRRFK